jgi:hypothetical protein
MAGVSQAVQIDQSLDLRPVNDVVNEIGTDKPGAASNQKFHGASLSAEW